MIRYEMGDSRPSEEVAVKLAKILGGKETDYRPELEHERALRRDTRELELLRAADRELRKRLDDIEAALARLLSEH